MSKLTIVAHIKAKSDKVELVKKELKKLKKKTETTIHKTQSNGGGLSESEISEGLKEALNQGVKNGVSELSKPGGYFNDAQLKIPLPKEARTAESKLRKLGQGKLVDQAVQSMNEAAEDAANGSKEIFVSAIKKMTLTDAKSILDGNDDAATRYLDKSTRAELTQKFKPVIRASLEKVNATKHWNKVFSTYNRIPLVKKINPNLEDYVTQKALDGLFIQIAREELEIRQDPAARVSDILKKIFG